jgi:hypothetical protein
MQMVRNSYYRDSRGFKFPTRFIDLAPTLGAWD